MAVIAEVGLGDDLGKHDGIRRVPCSHRPGQNAGVTDNGRWTATLVVPAATTPT